MQKNSKLRTQTKHMNPILWEKVIREYLTSKKKLHVLSYQEISKRLTLVGVEQSPQNLSAKFNQGKLSAALFFSTLQAMGEKQIDLRELVQILDGLQENAP